MLVIHRASIWEPWVFTRKKKLKNNNLWLSPCTTCSENKLQARQVERTVGNCQAYKTVENCNCTLPINYELKLRNRMTKDENNNA